MAQGFGAPSGAPHHGQWTPRPQQWPQSGPQWAPAQQGYGQQGYGQPGYQPGAPSGQFPTPGPRGSRLGPIILVSLGVVGLAFLGLILYSVFSGPTYEQEDYVPPPPGNVTPLPDLEYSEYQAILENNPLYAQSVPRPVRCELSNPGISIDGATDEEIKDYIDELMACNMRVWDQPFVDTQRFSLVRPKVNIYHESVTSPCGGGRARGPNASYCAANQEVYWSRELPRRLPLLEERVGVDIVMSHEFAHAIQARSGVIEAFAVTQAQSDRRTGFELQRRTETQADCLAGMWINSVAQSMEYTDEQVAYMISTMRATGSEEPNEENTHGSAPNRAYWVQVGMSGGDIGRCNTFVAPSEQVR